MALEIVLVSLHSKSDTDRKLGLTGRLSLPVVTPTTGGIPRDDPGNVHPSEGESDNKELTPTHNSICSRIRRGTLAADLWRRGLPRLVEALQHPRDSQGIHNNWTAELLNLLSPHVLENAIKGFPSMETLRPLFNILSRRIGETSASLSLESSPLLKMVVLGGSIVEGTGCMRSPLPGGGGKIDFESMQECAWPCRLEHALNFFLSKWFPTKPRIHIHNLAAGGTNSEAAIPILRYWLSPVFHPNGADVVFNAYSANDNLPPAFHATTNTTMDSYHLARVLKRNLEFIQASRDLNHHQQDQCQQFHRPLILYVNDYVGNQQESIIGDGQLDQAIQWLADIEATMGYVSISHAVRRWVWADTSEDFFSPPWLDRKGRPTINVHYGMGGHVTTTIAILYYFLRLLLDFCDDDIHYENDDTLSSPASSSNAHPSALQLEDYIQIDIPTKEWIQDHHPPFIRPNLTQWNWNHSHSNSHLEMTKASTKCDNHSSSPRSVVSPCAFAFLAAPLGTHQRQDLLAEFLRPFTIQQDGWMVQNDFRQGGFQNKLGLVATQPGATMTLSIDAKSSTTIRFVTIHYLKSYGDLWQNSRVEFRAQVILDNHVIHQDLWTLEGFHEQSVSISYFYQVKLTDPIPPNASFQLQMRLVSGQTFKINALMFCSR